MSPPPRHVWLQPEFKPKPTPRAFLGLVTMVTLQNESGEGVWTYGGRDCVFVVTDKRQTMRKRVKCLTENPVKP